MKKDVGSPSQGEDTPPAVADAWTARMQVENFKTGKKERVTLEVIARRPSLLRIDAKGTFGILGGIGLLKDEKVLFVLPRQKRAYHGAASGAALEPLLNISMDPRVLIPLFYDENPPGWDCTPPESDEPESRLHHCEQNGVKVAVTERDMAQRKASIEGPGFKALLIIKNDGTKVLGNDDQFNLVVPEGYRIHKLQ